MQNVPDLCFCCRHLRRKGPNGLTCAAFADGIPLAILENEVDHRRSLPGDQGVVFAPRDDAPRDILSWTEGILDSLPARSDGSVGSDGSEPQAASA